MPFADGKLGKMTIIFYPEGNAPGAGGIVFTPMYNPTTLTVNHGVQHDTEQQSIKGNISKKFLKSTPRSMSMELFFDGTGASPGTQNNIGIEDALFASETNRVDIEVQTFLKLGYQIQGDTHEPMFMMVMWGTFVMTGVLTSANVTYEMFASDGKPLRARMSVSIDEFVPDNIIGKILRLASPDISKSIVVKEGDTLPLLCHKEYGDSNLYTQVAEANQLKNFRKLEPGTELLFPPIEKES